MGETTVARAIISSVLNILESSLTTPYSPEALSENGRSWATGDKMENMSLIEDICFRAGGILDSSQRQLPYCGLKKLLIEMSKDPTTQEILDEIFRNLEAVNNGLWHAHADLELSRFFVGESSQKRFQAEENIRSMKPDFQKYCFLLADYVSFCYGADRNGQGSILSKELAGTAKRLNISYRIEEMIAKRKEVRINEAKQKRLEERRERAAVKKFKKKQAEELKKEKLKQEERDRIAKIVREESEKNRAREFVPPIPVTPDPDFEEKWAERSRRKYLERTSDRDIDPDSWDHIFGPYNRS